MMGEARRIMAAYRSRGVGRAFPATVTRPVLRSIIHSVEIMVQRFVANDSLPKDSMLHFRMTLFMLSVCGESFP